MHRERPHSPHWWLLYPVALLPLIPAALRHWVSLSPAAAYVLVSAAVLFSFIWVAIWLHIQADTLASLPAPRGRWSEDAPPDRAGDPAGAVPAEGEE